MSYDSYDSDEVVEKRKERSRFRGFRNFLILVLLAGFCGFFYVQRDQWLPKLEGIGSRYEETITQNDGTLAEGNFPLTISGSTGYDAQIVGDTLFLLHDAYVDLYSLHGDSRDTRQHAFQNAAMVSNGKYALIYESGGTSFRLDTKHKNIYGKSVEEDIIAGAVSDNGTVALITESSAYACSIHIYDNTGKQIYQRDCTEHVVDVAFHDDNEGCYFTSIDVVDGVLESTVTSILFRQMDVQWTSLPLETMVVQTEVASDGSLCVVGNTACAYYSSDGEALGTYAYDGTLVSADVESGRVALILTDDQKRDTSLVLLNRSASDVTVKTMDNTASLVQVCDGDAYVMCPGNVTSYDFSGTAIATVDLEGSYTSFLKQDAYLFLMGYDQIDRVDFKE